MGMIIYIPVMKQCCLVRSESQAEESSRLSAVYFNGLYLIFPLIIVVIMAVQAICKSLGQLQCFS